jgi:hypothetical protein
MTKKRFGIAAAATFVVGGIAVIARRVKAKKFA